MTGSDGSVDCRASVVKLEERDVRSGWHRGIARFPMGNHRRELVASHILFGDLLSSRHEIFGNPGRAHSGGRVVQRVSDILGKLSLIVADIFGEPIDCALVDVLPECLTEKGEGSPLSKVIQRGSLTNRRNGGLRSTDEQ